MQVAIGFGFPSHWLINWREIFKPITNRSNCNRVFTFYSYLKTALSTPHSTDIMVPDYELIKATLGPFIREKISRG